MYSTNDVSLLPLPRLIACTDNIAENIAMPIGYTVNAVWFKYLGQVFTQEQNVLVWENVRKLAFHTIN
jgi:hypothetical protein